MTVTGRLQTIEIDGLFGSDDTISIPVDRHQPTVLTGGNGTGKSTILRLVGAASTLDIAVLSTAPLTSLRLHFDGIPSFVCVNKTETTTVTWGRHKHSMRRTPSGLDVLPDWASEAMSLHYGVGDLGRRLRQFAQAHNVPPSEYRQVREALLGELSSRDWAIPDWATELRKAFTVLHVTDQRLVVDADVEERRFGGERVRSSRRAVVAASRDIADQMLQIDSDYARASQARDRMFPREVIAAMSTNTSIDEPRLQRLLQEVNAKREELRRVGLLDTQETFDEDFALAGLDREEVRPVIAAFLSSTLSKLQVLDDLSSRLQTFRSFIDARFKNKRVALQRREGVRIVLPNGATILPDQLSSGEQQLFVLAYEILFRAPQSALMIVDEPEISLHVLWQDTLIEDLSALGRPSNIQFLMATHSPALLANHPELERSLDEEDSK